ncbi:MAG: hypothetical protein K6G10_00225 [Butyrivibrio sp.]|nr:hypothetical protein [Butyrivibrio sp.]
MKILQKLLFIILGIVMMLGLVIALYANVPPFADALRAAVDFGVTQSQLAAAAASMEAANGELVADAGEADGIDDSGFSAETKKLTAEDILKKPGYVADENVINVAKAEDVAANAASAAASNVSAVGDAAATAISGAATAVGDAATSAASAITDVASAATGTNTANNTSNVNTATTGTKTSGNGKNSKTGKTVTPTIDDYPYIILEGKKVRVSPDYRQTYTNAQLEEMGVSTDTTSTKKKK